MSFTHWRSAACENAIPSTPFSRPPRLSLGRSKGIIFGCTEIGLPDQPIGFAGADLRHDFDSCQGGSRMGRLLILVLLAILSACASRPTTTGDTVYLNHF